jgi:putative membrane protein
MNILVQSLVGLIILIHLYVLWLEMFAWTTRASKVFKGYPKEYFESTKVLAANQGLYNGFLAAGLIWSFFIPDHVGQQFVRYFFLGCVAVAGIFGAMTADKKIFFIQALPAILAMVLLYFAC